MRPFLLATLFIAPTAALAHPGHEGGGLIAGMAHPIGGADHVLAMVALGLLAAQIGGRALMALPVAFVVAMVLGGAAGFGGLPFPAVEPMILASVMVLGVMVALAVRPNLAGLVALAALFGAAHGWAHGAEGPQAGMAAYALGFAGMTALLHGAGIVAGLGLKRLLTGWPLRALGGATAVAGFGLVLA
jgi:urease accessory protein